MISRPQYYGTNAWLVNHWRIPGSSPVRTQERVCYNRAVESEAYDVNKHDYSQHDRGGIRNIPWRREQSVAGASWPVERCRRSPAGVDDRAASAHRAQE